MKRLIRKVTEWFKARHTRLCELRDRRRMKTLERESRHAIQITEFGGGLYVSHYSVPVVAVDPVEDDLTAILETARAAYVRYRLEDRM